MTLVHTLIYLYIWILVLAALVSWFPSSSSGWDSTRRFLGRATEPVLRPLRRVLPRPRLGGVGIDLSVLVAIILLEFINRLI